MEKITMKEKVLRFVESKGSASFTEIQRFIYDTKYGSGSYDNGVKTVSTYVYYKKNKTIEKKLRKMNSNRGYYCGAFSRGYFNITEKKWYSGGYFLRGKNRLAKTHNGQYKTIRE